MENAP